EGRRHAESDRRCGCKLRRQRDRLLGPELGDRAAVRASVNVPRAGIQHAQSERGQAEFPCIRHRVPGSVPSAGHGLGVSKETARPSGVPSTCPGREFSTLSPSAAKPSSPAYSTVSPGRAPERVTGSVFLKPPRAVIAIISVGDVLRPPPTTSQPGAMPCHAAL